MTSPDPQIPDYGPPAHYELFWLGGEITEVKAHSVSYPTVTDTTHNGDSHIKFHEVVDGHWTLVLSTQQRQVESVRIITPEEYEIRWGEVARLRKETWKRAYSDLSE